MERLLANIVSDMDGLDGKLAAMGKDIAAMSRTLEVYGKVVDRLLVELCELNSRPHSGGQYV